MVINRKGKEFTIDSEDVEGSQEKQRLSLKFRSTVLGIDWPSWRSYHAEEVDRVLRPLYVLDKF